MESSLRTILECDACASRPHKQELDLDESPPSISGLEVIYAESSTPDRYTEVIDRVLRCLGCATAYHQHHSIDTEDAFVGGPSISHTVQRYNLERLKSTLAHLGRGDELAALERTEQSLVARFEAVLRDDFVRIPPYILPFVLEVVADFRIQRDDWDGLEEALLTHPSPDIALAAARDVILVFGEYPRNCVFPDFTYYRDFIPDLQRRIRSLLPSRVKRFETLIRAFESSTDDSVPSRVRDVLHAARYYQVLDQ